MYSGLLRASEVAEVVASGVDRHEIGIDSVGTGAAAGSRVRVDVVLTAKQARALRRSGVPLRLKRIDGATVSQRATLQGALGHEVFRPYAGAGGLRQEFERAARNHPGITELETYGRTVNGRAIIALKVTRGARTLEDGSRPAVLYVGAQHAREWITPEMIRRLMHHVLDGYGTNARVTRLVDDNELWFVPVANPDGYDWSFRPGQRLWRKNLRDTNGDGRITAGEGVDLNRNFPIKWGYDNEGSSQLVGNETYRGTAPASEPETRALDSLAARVGFEFMLSYHSAAELLLYGTGWQVSTPTPDDVIFEALAGPDPRLNITGGE